MVTCIIKNPERQKPSGIKIKSGNDLLSHNPAVVVSSAMRGLTSLFEMGRGVTPSLESPETFYTYHYGPLSIMLKAPFVVYVKINK
jgi:hypothetical protein